MTAPANPPPAAILQSLSGDRAPTMTVAFTNGSGDMDLTDRTHWSAPCASELFFPAGGTLNAQLAGDSAPQSYAVPVGAVVRGAWVLIKSACSSCVARW